MRIRDIWDKFKWMLWGGSIVGSVWWLTVIPEDSPVMAIPIMSIMLFVMISIVVLLWFVSDHW